MLPEISRRCLACGASVRAGARFCPQCGNRFPEEDAGEAAGGEEGGRPAEAREAVRPTRETAAPARESAAPTRETAAPPRAFDTAPPPPQTFEAAAPQPPTSVVAEQAPASFREPDGLAPAAVAFQPPPDAGVEAAPGGRLAAEGADGAGRSRRAAARVKESVKESVLPRVEKMRDEALVALEETPDDSGLRFVLIAAALFALFLLLFFLSTTVLR